MRHQLLITLLFCLLMPVTVFSQILSPVEWDIKLEKKNNTEGVVIFEATIEKGWHLYSTKSQEGGPIPTSVKWVELKNVELIGELTSDKTAHKEKDLNFDMIVEWWTDNVVLRQNFKFTNPDDYDISGEIKFMACNDQTCLSPQNKDFRFVNNAAPILKEEIESDSLVSAFPVIDNASENNGQINKYDFWKPVEFNGSQEVVSQKSFWYIFIGGFIGGLLALLTPCVWPMIPLTVSFFLKKHSDKRKSVRDAIIYGLSIVIIYLIVGIAITLAFGPNKLNELSTNAVFNIIFFLLLVMFAMSFFGAFEITLPSKWTNKMDATAERTTGLVSIFFMAFTLILVSFSCTGPIIGTLLVEAVSLGDLTGPVVGMGAFALALAIPFTLFAIFPSWLKELPKSGGWMNSVKVVLGFIELALSLKFLSVADLAYGWRILDREVFLVLWIAIFVLLGMYLLGKIRFTNDSKVEKIGVPRFFLALISISFAIYLIPGLWGAPLRSVSAFAPPLSTQDFNLYQNESTTIYDDFDKGMISAMENKKPVFLEFSGYGCVNCRKMEAAVIDKKSVREYIKNNFVTIKLMVDDRKELKEPMKVVENGKTVKLRTYGDLWSYLQRHKFRANSQPYYIVLNNDGSLLSGPAYYDEDIDKFMQFLINGVEKYNSEK